MPSVSGSNQARLSDSGKGSTKISPEDEPVPEIEYESEKSEAPDTEKPYGTQPTSRNVSSTQDNLVADDATEHKEAADSEGTVSGVGLSPTQADLDRVVIGTPETSSEASLTYSDQKSKSEKIDNDMPKEQRSESKSLKSGSEVIKRKRHKRGMNSSQESSPGSDNGSDEREVTGDKERLEASAHVKKKKRKKRRRS